MSDLLASDIIDLRRNWLRDEWLDSPAFRGISYYNTAAQKNFFTDAQIKALDDYVANEYTEVLTEVALAKTNARMQFGDDSVTASTYGLQAERYARYRLIRAEAYVLMLGDAGFVSTLAKNYANVLASMESQIKSDRAFVLGRTGLVVLRRRRS